MTSPDLTCTPPNRPIRVAAIQMASATADKAANLAKAERLIEAAEADLAVLPELFATEFFAGEKDPRFFDYAEPVDGPLIRKMTEVARRTATMLAVPLFEYGSDGRYYNSTVLIGTDGATIGCYRKTHVPLTLTHEKYYFAPGNAFPVFDTPLGRIGILICYDRWYPEAWSCLRDAGAEIVCVPISSWEYQGGSEAPVWDALHQIRAKENQLFIVAANRTGREGKFTYIGRSLLLSPSGEVLGAANGTEETALTADIDLGDVRRARGRWPLLRDRRPEIY